MPGNLEYLILLNSPKFHHESHTANVLKLNQNTVYLDTRKSA